MEKNWTYIERTGDAGLPKRPPRFKDLGEHSIEIFVRELIQNSLDAQFDNSKPVSINIKIEEWDRGDINDFFKLIGKDYLSSFEKSYEKAIADVKPKMTSGVNLIKGKKNKSFALTIEEHNCIGLTGSIRGLTEKSNFNSLMRKTDDNEVKKESLSNSGGTWGKGSSVYIYSSDLWMWFCYTLLSKPNSEDFTPAEKTRFMGRAILSPYYAVDEGKGYWGDTWFCEKDTDVFPYANEKADAFAEIFGLNKRTDSPGCTFFIPFFNTFLTDPKLDDVANEFESQILKNWFIPIYNGNLEVSISDNNGLLHKIDKEYLKNIEQLKFKLQILDWHKQGCPPDERFIWEKYEIDVPPLKKEYIGSNNKFAEQRQKVKFDLLLRKIDEDEDFENEWDTINKVYLARNRGMLVDNYKPFDLTSIKTESILFTGLLSFSESDKLKKQHLDLFLAYAENPAHNKWCTSSKDYNSCFLDFFEGKNPYPENVVRKVFDEIFKSFKKLFDEERKPEISKDICSIFKKIARLKVIGEASGGVSFYSMRTPSNVTNPIVDEEGRYIFTYLIKSNQKEKSISISFKPLLQSLEGETDKEFDLLGIPDFKNLILKDEYEDSIISGDLILGPQEEKLVEIKTCKIIGVPAFKNLETIIKSNAKINSNE
jgi:hypothetical protein